MSHSEALFRLTVANDERKALRAMALDSSIWRSRISFGFRAAVIGQTLTVVGQALLAGLALSGNASALHFHMVLGGLALLTGLMQAGLAFALLDELPRWMVLISVGLLFGEAAQMASGRSHLFALHLPLGVALFAGLTVSSIWVLNASQSQRVAA